MLAMLMIIGFGTSVFADDEPTPDTKSTNVTYSVEAGYEWTQPANMSSIVFDDTDGGKVKTGNLSVTKAVLASDEVLNIYIRGDEDGEFKIVSEEGASLTYEVKKGTDTLTKDSVVLSINAGETDLATNGVVELSFELNDTNAGKVAGTFSGVCTFEAMLEAVATPTE